MRPAGFDLTGRVALVTGAGGLLGRQHVHSLAEAGATVIALDRDGASLTGLATGAGQGEVRTATADVTDPEQLATVARDLATAYGRVDVLVNNAAIDDKVGAAGGNGMEAGVEAYPLAQWRRVLDTNVTGVFLPCQIFGGAMARAGGGSIINIASTYGLVAPDPAMYRRADGTRMFVKSPAYPASKGAVLALTRYFAAYWGEQGVRVNALAPGGVENGQDPDFRENYRRRTPLGRMARPEDYRGALLFLASDASAYTTGSTVVVDGGFTAW